MGGFQPNEGRRTASVIAAGDRAVCLARADDFVNAHESAETAHRTRAWTKQPPTDRQVAYLPPAVCGTSLTRYEASCHLARRFNRRSIDQALSLPHREVA